MAYGQPAARTRFNFDAVAVIAANQRKAERKKLHRLRKVRRALHFIGFLSYWAIIVGITYLLTTATMILFVFLT